MKEFLIFILTVLLIYYGGKLFFRYFLPWIIMRYFEKQSNNFMDAMHHGYENKRKKEGEISVKKGSSKSPKSDNKDFGEYIDFEEIDENE